MKKKVICLLTALVTLTSTTSFAMSRDTFDSLTSKGIQYFDKGMYREAKDELQWFCDANWGAMNEGQQNYILGYLESAKRHISEESKITRAKFDEGMAKGIEYFNKGMYYEAKNEFQRFCDAKWGVMNEGQQKYALGYLEASKKRIAKYESAENLKRVKYFSNVDEYNGVAYTPHYLGTNGAVTAKKGNIDVRTLPGKASNAIKFTFHNGRIYYLDYIGGSGMTFPAEIRSCDMNGNNDICIASDACFACSYNIDCMIIDEVLYYDVYRDNDEYDTKEFGQGIGGINSINLSTMKKTRVIDDKFACLNKFDRDIIYTVGEDIGNYRYYNHYSYNIKNKNTKSLYEDNYNITEGIFLDNYTNTKYYYDYMTKTLRVGDTTTGESYPIWDFNRGYVSISRVTDKYIYIAVREKI